jgi:hypothetical protein
MDWNIYLRIIKEKFVSKANGYTYSSSSVIGDFRDCNVYNNFIIFPVSIQKQFEPFFPNDTLQMN